MTKIIMVVDDNPDITYSVKHGLKDLDKDYKVICAENGEECFKLLKNNQIPNLILLDIMMRGMSGWDVAAELKKNPKWKDIPLFFLTAKTDSFSQTFGSIVSEDYSTKPFEITDLRDRINKVLNR